MRFHIPVLLISVAAGLVGGFADYFLYGMLAETMSLSVLIALLFVVFAVIVGGTLLVAGIVTDLSDETFFFLDGRGKLIAALAAILIVLFLLGAMLQWLYQMEKSPVSQPTSYIFLLDESSSMNNDSSDKDKERYPAVNTVMNAEAQGFPFAVYAFAGDCTLLRPMAPLSEGEFQMDETLIETLDVGRTDIAKALQTVLEDIQNGALANAGAAPRVVLLSDGGSYVGNNILTSYRNSNVSISTVNLGVTDKATMQRIAQKTGGVSISINRAEDLKYGFSRAALLSISRDLLGTRDVVSSELLYAILRILFLMILGALVAVIKSAAWGEENSNLRIILAGAITSLLGAILMEVLLLLELPLIIPYLLYWVLVAVTLVSRPSPPPPVGADEIHW